MVIMKVNKYELSGEMSFIIFAIQIIKCKRNMGMWKKTGSESVVEMDYLRRGMHLRM